MNKTIGESKLSEILPHLKSIAEIYGLRLNRLKEFRIAKMLFATIYLR